MNTIELEKIFEGYFDVTRVFEHTEAPTLVLHKDNRKIGYIFPRIKHVSFTDNCTSKEKKTIRTLALLVGLT